MKKIVKYGVLILAIGLLGYNAVYIKKLSEVKTGAGDKFNASLFVSKLWAEKMPSRMDSAVDLDILKTAIAADPQRGFDTYSHALAIGNYRYALIKVLTRIDEVREDDMQITILGDTPLKGVLLTEFVYGNTVRDASELVSLRDFPNTSDLNGISEEMNKIVRKQLVPAIKQSFKAGDTIMLTGAVELNKEHIRFDDLEIIPLRVKMAD